MKLKDVSSVFMAAFLAVSPSPSHAEDKIPTPIGQYCAMQNDQNSGALHQQRTVFRPSFTDVNVYSRAHGSIKLTNFNCETLVPVCKSGGFVFSEGSLSSIHNSLGAYNTADDPVIVKSIKALGKSSKTLSVRFVQTNDGLAHLQGTRSGGHGLDIQRIKNGVMERGSVGDALLYACADQIIK